MIDPLDFSSIPLQRVSLQLSPQTSLQQTIAAMSTAKTSCALIVQDQKLLGIFTERDVVRLTTYPTFDPDIPIANVMTQTVITIQDSDNRNLFDLSRFFRKHNIRHLPVLDKQSHLIGVITLRSLRQYLQPEHLLRYIRVSEILRRDVIQAFSNDHLLLIADRMVYYKVSCVVIIDRDRFPVGIVTERDIVRLKCEGINFATTVVASVMSAPLETTHGEDSLWAAHQKMQALRVRRLVIVNEQNRLAGMITQTDIMHMFDPLEMFHVMKQMQAVIDRQTRELQQTH
jgi:CBS domain-containing protein